MWFEAASGGGALEVIKDHRLDAILMDLALPGLDGFEAIRRIRAIDAFQNTPIIVLTAYTGPSTYDAALRAGPTYLMGKPIDFDQLAALLKRVLFEGNRRNSRHNRAASQRAMLRDKPMVPPRGGRELHLQRLTGRLRNLERKCRTLADAAFDRDGAAMKFDDLLNYRQAQSHATFLRLLICL